MKKITLAPMPRSFDVVEMIRNLYEFMRNLAELVNQIVDEIEKLQPKPTAAAKPKEPKGA